jgi:hypothetical protein
MPEPMFFYTTGEIAKKKAYCIGLYHRFVREQFQYQKLSHIN